MHTIRTMTTGRCGSAAAVLRAAIVTGFGLLVCACQTDQVTTAAPDVPYDYRLRHPITITESERTLQIFIGSNRGDLTAEQRAEVLAFAQTWLRSSNALVAEWRSLSISSLMLESFSMKVSVEGT